MPLEGLSSAFESETFGQNASFRLEHPVGSMSISPCGRDVVLASREGLHIIDLDTPYSPPRYLPHRTAWEVADVQWSPHASKDHWVVSTSNQKALVWNLAARELQNAIEFVLHGHTRAITDINFSAHHPEILATCAVDSFVHCWDLRTPGRPAFSFSDWFAGATQVKWSRQDPHVVASSHDRFLHIWDDRMGAYPRRTIEAHGTKIYGVDWNRFDPQKVVTCSLDKTIKFWDTGSSEDVPEKIINTPFPVWRARHTPFGWGILAMPQRSNNDLHLYDRREEAENCPSDACAPVASFAGHKGQVKEFLWRARGTISQDVDHRDFQLVSWGTDKELRLHKVEPEALLGIGYEKGITKTLRLNVTRKGAIYRTFRDEPSELNSPVSLLTPGENSSLQSQVLRLRPRGTTSVGMSKVPIPQFRGWARGTGIHKRTGMHGKSNVRPETSPIAWMKNVRIATWDQETLADEITQIGEKFTKVKFEDVDVQQRRATVSLHGPWGEQNDPVYLRIDMRFPKLYPRDAAAKFNIQKNSALAEPLMETLATEVQTITETYATRKKGCIEAMLRYLLRDQTLEQAISVVLDETRTGASVMSGTEMTGDVSSDDDDDQIQAPTDLLNTSNANVRVPLAKACGALWSDSGKLVCFFPPKNNQPSITGSLQLKTTNFSQSERMFEGFGRLHTSSPGPRTTIGTKTDDEDTSDNSDSSSSPSSPGSSASTDDARVVQSGYLPHRPWRRTVGLQGRTDSANRSNRSTNDYGSAPFQESLRANVLSIHTFEDLIPSKASLGLGYKIFGTGADVCYHNALVALQEDDEQLSSVWHLAKLILEKNIPLDCLREAASSEDIFLIARTGASLVARRDSGVDLQDDIKLDRRRLTTPGRIRWGNSPLGPSYLITAMFSHFEKLGDVQMLAMLSCVFAEPKATHPELLLASRDDQDMSIELTAPAFSLDYYPSMHIARSILNPFHEPALLSGRRSGVPMPMAVAPDSGSSGTTHSADGKEIVAGSTPPLPSGIPLHAPRGISRATSVIAPEYVAADRSGLDSAVVSLSTSPEEHRMSRRSNSTVAFSFSRASLSAVQQSYSNSPPGLSVNGFEDGQKSHSPSGSIVPNVWGTGGIFGSTNPGRSSRHMTHASTVSSDEPRVGHILSSTSFSNLRAPRRGGAEMPEPRQRMVRSASKRAAVESAIKSEDAVDGRRPRMTVTLHNQEKFDVDGYASVPLLDPDLEWKFRAYRAAYAHLLGVWQLYPQMTEVLKFDGLVGHFSAETEKQDWAFSNAHRRKTMAEEFKAATLAKRGLDVRQCCRQCGNALATIEKNGIPIGWHCTIANCTSSATKPLVREICTICNKVINSMMVPCLECGHITCYSCAEGWFGPKPDSKLIHQNTGREKYDGPETGSIEQCCPTGCGCLCATLDTIFVPDPDITEPEHGDLPETSPVRQRSPKTYRSERLMSEHGPDTAIGAFLSLTRTRSISAAKESMMRDKSIEESSAIEVDPPAPIGEDELYPWASSTFAGLGRGIGGGLSRGLSTKSSDATIRKAGGR